MVTFEIIEHLGQLSSTNTTTKELNLVSWNGQPAKLDLRSWRTDQSGQRSPNKGITIADDEAATLTRLLLEYGRRNE